MVYLKVTIEGYQKSRQSFVCYMLCLCIIIILSNEQYFTADTFCTLYLQICIYSLGMTLYYAAEYEIPVGKVIYNSLNTPSLICFKEFVPREEHTYIHTLFEQLPV